MLVVRWQHAGIAAVAANEPEVVIERLGEQRLRLLLVEAVHLKAATKKF